MARVQVLGQRCPHGGKMLIRGVFTQRKKLWEAMAQVFKPESLTSLSIFDDTTNKTVPATYDWLCKLLRENGRAALVDESERREFQIVDAETNILRDWDVDEEGPRCNPVEK